MSRRVYTLKNKTTGLFLWGASYRKPYKGEDTSGKRGPKKAAYYLDYLDNPNYTSADQISWLIERMMNQGFSTEVDNLDLEAFDIPEPLPLIPVKSTMKIPTIKKRIEAKQIMRKLKAGR